ncbi:hypothetical protein HX049_17740 [Myroides odoratimimus]|uniref:hypothetical protein n=1 Tax=Myroides odoratimimus TaxID=76832 RepID=UPI002576E4F6|nr:hypothetical protein [Myroides odoratimimus]MDM1398979.1 hypothetical protein [Myroides odoratimimus]
MKKNLSITFLLISLFCQGQEISNKFLQDLGVNLELGKQYDYSTIINEFPYIYYGGTNRKVSLFQNKYFKEAKVVFNYDNILTEIILPFKNKKTVIKEIDNVLAFLPNTIKQEGYDYSDYKIYSLKEENEDIRISIRESKISSFSAEITFNFIYTNIIESYDKFDKQTIFKTQSDENTEKILSLGQETSWIELKYFAISKLENDTPKYYLRFYTKNNTWKFFKEIQFLIDDDEVIKIELDSKKDIMLNAETSEFFIMPLDDFLISKLLDCKEVSARFIGKNIEKTTFNKQNVKPLQKLIETVESK